MISRSARPSPALSEAGVARPWATPLPHYAARLVPDVHIERVVDASQRAVPIPQVQVLPDRAARRQVLRKRLPLAARPKHVEDGVQDLADVHRPRAPTALGGRDQRADQRPLGVSQITLVPQATTIRRRSMFRLPHEAPLPDSGATQGITTDSTDSTSFRIGS